MEFVIGSDKLYQNVSDCLLLCLPYSDEEVDHEAGVKGEVDLLAGVVTVGDAVLHSLPEIKLS